GHRPPRPGGVAAAGGLDPVGAPAGRSLHREPADRAVSDLRRHHLAPRRRRVDVQHVSPAHDGGVVNMPTARPGSPGAPRGGKTDGMGCPGGGGLPGRSRAQLATSQPGSESGSGYGAPVTAGVGALDLEALRAEPELIDELAGARPPARRERRAVERRRRAPVGPRAPAALARVPPELTVGTEGLLTARQAARRLGVSPDYLRDHGEALGLAIHLDGMVRYDPAAIARLRRPRQD